MKTDEPQTTSIKEYNYRATYHTSGSADFRIFADSPEQAKQIATRLYYEKFTSSCILDSVEPIDSKKEMNIHKCTGLIPL